MEGREHAHDVVMRLFKVRMSFRQLVVSRIRRERMDMTFEMMQILHRLYREQGVSQRILADKIYKDKACLTNLIGNLEKKGWVARKTDPADRRNRLVYLTNEGKEIASRISEALDEMYALIAKKVGQEALGVCLTELDRLDLVFNELK